MSDLAAYLHDHYREAAQFAADCGITLAQLDRLIADGCIPGPSYVVTATSIRSHVFGEIAVSDAVRGRYFHPGNRAWVERALRSDAPAMRAEFRRDFAAALAELDRTTWRLTDSYTDAGDPIAAGLERRLDQAWESFLHGTFGLCVADPSTTRSIARKEVLQEQLTVITCNGADAAPATMTHDALLQLIDAYAAASMPFSPAEYPRSSRKRLVDDLRVRVQGMRDALPQD